MKRREKRLKKNKTSKNSPKAFSLKLIRGLKF